MPTSLQSLDRDLRDAPRLSLYLAASLYCDGAASAVKIRNISSTGALVESSAAFATGSLVQLVRGSLIVHALVAWTEDGRCGLNFSGSIDVQKWRASPVNTEQQRIDDIVRVVKGGAIPLPVSVPKDGEAAGGTTRTALASDLQRVAELLRKLGDRLARDDIVVANYAVELQNLDIAMQVAVAVGAILNERGDVTKIASLRNSADQALSREAG